jgi:hypothetical protein
MGAKKTLVIIITSTCFSASPLPEVATGQLSDYKGGQQQGSPSFIHDSGGQAAWVRCRWWVIKLC